MVRLFRTAGPDEVVRHARHLQREGGVLAPAALRFRPRPSSPERRWRAPARAL